MHWPGIIRSGVAALVASMLAFSAACHEPERYQPLSPDNTKGLNPDDVLALAAAPSSIPADGVSRTRITAQIDPSAVVRTITFSTSHGTLFGDGKTAAASNGSLSIVVDANGLATIELRSSADIVTARITATMTVTAATATAPAQTLVRTLDVSFVPVRADELLQLETDRTSLPADGFSTATITATVKSSGDLQQDVTFATSRGTLTRFGAAAADTGTVVRADATGVARIQLRSDTTVGTARVTAKVLGFEREIFVEFVAVNPSDIVTVEPDREELPADGATRTRIVARLSPTIPDANRQVTFTTTDGTFTSNVLPNTNQQTAQVKADASNTAIVEIRSPSTAAVATITASASNVTARTTITFTRALPDTIFLEADDDSVTRTGTDSVTIDAFLLRDVGQVTNNTVVTFEARDASGAVIGAFSGITLATVDSADPSPQAKRLKATAKFNPDDTAALGNATVIARAGGVEGRITVRITN